MDAQLQQFHGDPWPANATGDRADWLVFSINLISNDDVLVANYVPVNTTGNIFGFDLTGLKPSLEPIDVVLYGAPIDGHPTWTAVNSFYYLPEKSNGSVTKVDNLNGGLWFRNAASNKQFRPLFPYGFFASYDGFLRNNSNQEVKQYADYGLNAMTPLTIYKDSTPIFNYMDSIDLKFMYNLREGYKNLTYVHEQIVAARNAEAVFAYWSTDEPDGWQDPFEYPLAAYNLIKSLDPYHPVAVVLNCQNYYFREYSVGTSDILMADVYPIGINSTFSKWGTACNATYGDCGCDNCQGNVQDVPNRFDDLSKYENWLGLPRKTKMFNPQSFHGQDYWFRDPSPAESHVMVLLSVNHGAQGAISWLYPTTVRLAEAHGALAKVLTKSPVVDFIVGGDRPHPVKNVTVASPDDDITVVDAAYWVVGRKMLVIVVNGGYGDINSTVEVPVPEATVVAATLWGSVSWRLQNFTLSVPSLPALGTSIVVLDLLI